MGDLSWESIKGTIADVLEIDPPRRAEYLDGLSLSPRDRSEIDALLASDPGAGGLLDGAVIDLAADILAEDGDVVEGYTIANYRIIREIGHGGMGAVFLAERTDEKLEQRVAIKLMRRELTGAKLREMFDRERDIIARLEHPNIVRVLDAGSTDDGVPFLVFEYVDGVPIDEFCAAEHLPLAMRLKLFVKACAAVSFAHRNLVVHRDIKPSNILVTAHGDLKLLDFGIAKLVRDGVLPENTNLAAMTPEYASPEHVRGEAVTTSSDVYSLGAVLYRIVAGKAPVNTDGMSLAEIVERASTPNVARPSETTVGESGGHVDPAELRGDIDNIVMKAVAVDPERRYASVDDMVADVWRHIDGKPVMARPASFGYVTAKFVRRHKVPVVATLLVIGSLVAGLTAAITQANTARQHAAIAKAEQDRSEKVSKFVLKVFGYANPQWYSEGSRFGPNATVVQAMQDMENSIDVEFADSPDIAAELHHKFAEVYQANKDPSLLDRARRHAMRALELRRQHYGPKHELVAKDLVYLYWTGLSESGRSDDETRARDLKAAIQMMRETNPANLNLPYMLEAYGANLCRVEPLSEERSDAYMKVYGAPAGATKCGLAVEHYKEMLELLRPHYPPNSGIFFSINCTIAALAAKDGRIAEVRQHLNACREGLADPATDPARAENWRQIIGTIDAQ